ncbi:hypothetical protein WA026_011079 [Henosepilachna vigintioctopunctata]|uniref:Elongation of very long chain fatty acids protein n=1 Tax=Henosepilachna vigintioctopunctata TaxID=420089 RepID=A0AAW1U0B2_9CUCU
MEDTVFYVIDKYNYVMTHVADQRTNEYWMLTSPWKPILVFSAYLLLIKKILPRYMKNREPMKIDNYILLYNVSQIFFNAYLLYKVIPVMLRRSPLCSPVDYSDSPQSRLELDLVNMYYLLKIYDLLDTVFFVLRKRDRQVTFLHLYHHAMMVTFPWVGAKFVPGGNTIFIGVFNVFVHMIMYFYYAITLWNSGLKKNVWWKKYLTQLQLVQFFSLAVMAITVLLNRSCTFPKSITSFGLMQNLFLIYLFGRFYYNAYICPPKKTTDAKKAS